VASPHVKLAVADAEGAAPRWLQDLRWLLLSPPLLATASGRFSAPVFEFSAPEREQIERWLSDPATAALPEPSALTADGSRRVPLGRWCERLIEHFLRHGPTHRLVAANLPLRNAAVPGSDHTTAGEIDFLLTDAAGRPWHWELAVKYFLCRAEGATAHAADFIGPDGAETLASKLEKLFGRQLAHRPPAPFGVAPGGEPWQPAALTRGWMFYRHGRPPPACGVLTPDHLRGWWLPFGDLTAFAAERASAGFRVLDRADWLGASAPSRVLSAAALPAALHAQWHRARPAGARRWPSALMVAELDAHGQERSRGFVLPPAPEGAV
jgi:uncharacterized protein